MKSASITINSGVKLGKFYMAKEINEALGVFRSMQIPYSKISGILMSEGIEGLLKYAFELRKFRGWQFILFLFFSTLSEPFKALMMRKLNKCKLKC